MDEGQSAQAANSAASSSVIVQIQGDGNTVRLGLPHLELLPRQGLFREIRRDAATGHALAQDLIRPFSRSIELIGRSTEIHDLQAWLRGDPVVSVRVLTGPAGVGKTRLAIELMEIANETGWRTGFLTRDELSRFLLQQDVGSWGWPSPVLAVLDGAAGMAQEMKRWLMALADHAVWRGGTSECNPPLRLLVLERSGDPNGGWWEVAFGRGQEGAVVSALLEPGAPVEVGPLRTAAQRRGVFRATLSAMGSTLAFPDQGGQDDFDNAVMQLSWGGQPLFLMMAAITAGHEGDWYVLRLGPDEIARNVAVTELDRVRDVVLGSGVDVAGAFVDHLVAVGTLRQALSSEEANEVIAQEASVLGYGIPRGTADLRDAMARALPNSLGGIEGVSPDVIGEALMINVWSRLPATTVRAAIGRAFEADPVAVFDALIRTCQDFAIHGHRAPVQWLTEVASGVSDIGRLMELSDAMPLTTLELREAGIEISRRLSEMFRNKEHSTGDALADSARLAASLNNLANRLSTVGDADAALDAAREAVDLYFAVVGHNSPSYVVPLVRGMNTLANCLSKSGLRDEAVEQMRQAVQLCKQLGTQTDIEPTLAMLLSNYANRLWENGHVAEAFARSGEAIRLYRELSAERPSEFTHLLANSLANLAFSAHNASNQQLALERGREAAETYRRLAATAPDGYLPVLADTLVSVSLYSASAGGMEEAITLSEEGERHYRRLIDNGAKGLRAGLARCLSNLSTHLARAGRMVAAEEKGAEAVDICRALVEEDSEQYERHLADVLSNQSVILAKLGRDAEAQAMSDEASALACL